MQMFFLMKLYRKTNKFYTSMSVQQSLQYQLLFKKIQMLTYCYCSQVFNIRNNGIKIKLQVLSRKNRSDKQRGMLISLVYKVKNRKISIGLLICVSAKRTCYYPKITGIHTNSSQPTETRERHQLTYVLRYQRKQNRDS